ncbi:unnamed protein product [Oncorhynchus mykiss]|uniref:G-protein coupled receptors family 1 profile domain-containing protein n=1 Tax=Oncorhynchus mykiss TaxID=8022 RepID=A0A060YLN9_ONCMY|nr:unnamed protein product [Oncorhynchus mykiss]
MGSFNSSGVDAFPVFNLNSSSESPYTLATIASLAALVSCLILFTVVGNVLVVIAVLTSRALKAPQNLFLVSLATADILVATLVMPFSLANELMGYWYFGKVWCGIYLALDVLFCTSSIVHLCAISLDRYWSVTQAVEYNLKRTPKRVKCIIVIVWLISAMISSPPLISIDKNNDNSQYPGCELNNDTWYILSSSIASFFAPCLIMILVYIRIYQVAKTRTRGMSEKKHGPATSCKINGDKENGHWQCPSTPTSMRTTGVQDENSAISKHSSRISRASNKSMDLRSSASRKKVSQAREKRFTFVLAVVMGVFVVCWFPFFFSYCLHGVCGDPCKIPDPLFKFFFWIGYCNSSLNPAIYTIFNQDFRRAFQKILCKSWKKSF